MSQIHRPQIIYSRLHVVLLGVVATIASIAAWAAPSIEDFARYPEYEMVKISPDGKHYAVSLRREGYLALLALDRASLAVTAQVKFNPPNEIQHFMWAKDSRLVATLATKLGSLDFALPTGEVYGINADGTDERWLVDPNDQSHSEHRNSFRGAVQIINRLPNDATDVIVVKYYGPNRLRPRSELAMFNVYSGHMRQIMGAPKIGSYMTINRGRTNAMAVARVKDLSMELYRRVDDDWQLLRKLPFESGELLPISMEDSGRTWMLDSVNHDTLTLISVEPNGEIKTQVSDPTYDINGVLMHGDDGQPFGVRYIADRPKYVSLNSDSLLARSFAKAARAFPNAWLDITSTTTDEKLAVLFVHSDRMAGRFYLLDADRDEPTFLLDSRRWLPPEDMRASEPFAFVSTDARAIAGYVTRPAGNPPFPTIVVLHGGPHAYRDEGQFDEEVQVLATHGYAVLQINYRGSAGYGKAFQHAGYGQWGDAIQQDIAAGVRAAIAQGIADRGRICVMGGSFGAYAAIMNAILNPELYRCAIGLSGLYDVPSILEHSDASRDAFGVSYLTAVLGGDGKALERISPLHQAARLTVPTLIAHGVRDARIPIDNARAFRDEVNERNDVTRRDNTRAQAEKRNEADTHRPVLEFVEYPGEGHGLFGAENRVDWYNRLLKFLGQHLAAAEPSAASRVLSPAEPREPALTAPPAP